MKNIPENLSNKIKTSLQTPANNADPKMSVTVVRAKDTVMDNTYWTTEVIRTKPGLGDLSVAPRRFKPYGSPNRIYEIDIQNGIVSASIREYPDKLKEGWKEQFALGPGKSVGIAFNGEWKFYKKRYRLVTDEKPWISWVDLDGDLWVQLWDEVDTKLNLSSNVVKVRMIRAWKNTAIHYLDQGIVAAYIKTDGKVYYRNFCIQEDYSEAWEYEKQLSGFVGIAVNVNLFITNDYRMGFVIEDNTGTVYWLITYRNWGGMASPDENITTGIRDIKLDVIPIKYYNTNNLENLDVSISDIFLNVAQPIYPVPVFAENLEESGKAILLRFSHSIDSDLSSVKSAFTIKDSNSIEYTILSTSAGSDNSEIIFNMSRFDSAFGDMTIIYNRTILGLDCLNQGSRFAIESFNFVFTPILVPPQGHALEYLQVGVNPMFVVTQVYHNSVYEEENINTGISDISIIVTKVGNNPL